MGPGTHERLVLGDPLEAAADDGFGAQLAAFDEANQRGSGKAMWFDIRHGRPRPATDRYLATAARRAHSKPWNSEPVGGRFDAANEKSGRNDRCPRRQS